MQARLLSSIRGFVHIEVRGKRTTDFLNQTLQAKLHIWDIVHTDEQTIRLRLVISHFFKLRPILKQTGCRLHVLERSGLPFFMDKLGRRKLFIAGFLFFLIGLYGLSSIVWRVEVTGNDKISEDQILKAARNIGIYQMQWKPRLRDTSELSRELQRMIPGTSWIGVKVEGTKIHIRIVESTIPEKKPLLSPRHLVADADAVITKLNVDQGRPIVKTNMVVRKGDILVSGLLGDEAHQQAVVSRGQVWGLVWHQYEISVPLTQKVKGYTGESKKKHYVVFGNRALLVWGFGKIPYTNKEIVESRKGWQWREWLFPVSLLKENVMEVSYSDLKLEPEEAKTIGIQQAEADLLQKSGEDAELVSQKILHEKVENGKVYMKVLFEVEEEITKELPILPSPGGS